MNIKTLLNFYKKAKKLIYISEELILLKHENFIDQNSKAKIVLANENNLTDLSYFQSQEYIDRFQIFLKDGDTGYLAYLDDKCIHRSWVKHTPQTFNLYNFVNMEIEQGHVYIHYCETAPQARGQNFFPHVLTKIVKDFKDKKIIYSYASSKNIASIKAMQKAGFKEFTKIKLVQILGLKMVNFSNKEIHDFIKIVKI